MASPSEPQTTITVQGSLDALQRDREATWDQDRLIANANLRRRVEEAAVRERLARPGDVLAPFALELAGGSSLTLDDLVAVGPAVLLFFRFGTCPACNVALPAYRDTLAPELRHLGVPLVAISPQAPDLLVEAKDRLDLGFAVASDPDGALIRALGIAFSPSDDAEERRALGEVLGTGRFELPYPTIVILDVGRRVRFIDAHPDWMVRTESATVLAALRELL